MMVSAMSMRRLALLGVCMAMVFSDVDASGNPYNSDPREDDVDSPPAMPYTSVPSPSPTGKPTRMPTRVPTVTPIFSPTPKPTIARTKSPTRSPTLKPSTAPTKSPTGMPLTRVEPTISPSASPTVRKNPTQSPAPPPSMAPSPTAGAPSDSACAVEDGFFGVWSDNVVVVTFGYELEYEQGYKESDIISGLESSFSDFLLPVLFPSQCPERRRVLTSFRRLETVGVSNNPGDVVLQNVACAKKQDGNECVVLDGSMTIYNDGGTNDEEKIREELKTGMESGAFDEAPIVRVSYVDLDSNPSNSDSNGNGTTETTPKSKRFVYGVVAVVATLLILVLAVIWRRKQKNDEVSTLGPDSTVNAAAETTAPDGATALV